MLHGLQHPGIVAVLDAGPSERGAWMAMEAVAGCDLTRYTRPARLLPPPLVARTGARVADALAYAHRQGVIHRDVKPANVLVDWATDTVKLSDFGLARMGEHTQTRSGVTLGSPDYMAPEQLAGGAVGPAADVYGLGASLFELLAGRRPHEHDSLGALLRAVATEPAPDLAGPAARPGPRARWRGDARRWPRIRRRDPPTPMSWPPICWFVPEIAGRARLRPHDQGLSGGRSPGGSEAQSAAPPPPPLSALPTP